MLTGLAQKGTVARYQGLSRLPWHGHPYGYRRTESTEPVLVNLVERGKPVLLLLQRRKGSRKAN